MWYLGGPGFNYLCISSSSYLSWYKLQEMGCDLELGTGLRLDQCGVCGGDGASCAATKHGWSQKHISRWEIKLNRESFLAAFRLLKAFTIHTTFVNMKLLVVIMFPWPGALCPVEGAWPWWSPSAWTRSPTRPSLRTSATPTPSPRSCSPPATRTNAPRGMTLMTQYRLRQGNHVNPDGIYNEGWWH